VFGGSVASAREQGIAHEVLNATEMNRRWPIFTLSEEMGGLYDPGAGMIRPERGIAAQLRLAEEAGADLHFGERAVDWRPAFGGGLEVETDAGVYGGDHLVIAAGAWTGYFVPDLHLPLEVERMPVFWFEPDLPSEDLSAGRLPVWIMDTGPDGIFYGFPYDPAAGLKVSRHHSEDVVDPDTMDRAERPADVERVRAFMRRHMPAANGPRRTSTVCLYTNTPDRNFVIDVHPAAPSVAFASACSGHGFKFAPVVGEILADMALGVSPRMPIHRFRADRFEAAAPAG
jgi:sarcosine oxidase